MINSNVKESIMAVDDTSANLRLLDELLSPHDYDVRPFPKASFALKAAESDPPALFLLDINMPEMNGYELCRALKNSDNLKDIPVIFLSASGETFDKVEAFESGGVDYISKPFQLEELLARIENHLTIHRCQIEIEEKNNQLEDALEQLKAAQAQLVQAEKMSSIGVLTAGIAHEINNPVSFMQVSASALEKSLKKLAKIIKEYSTIDSQNVEAKLKTIEKQKQKINFDSLVEGIQEMVSNISCGSERTAEIVKSLRTFSRLDQADRKLADINENIESTLTILKSKFRYSIDVKKDFGEIQKTVCFPGKLNQVFMNLLVNAMDAIEVVDGNNEKYKGVIDIKTSMTKRNKEKYIVIMISDNGCGMTKEVQDKMFDPFYTTKDVGKGTGLGLAISHGIIKEHDGEVEVDSSPEKGTTYRIYLPLCNE
jgi:signal transduction histidine kinase